MTTTRKHPAADHATETERAIANLYESSREAIAAGIMASTGTTLHDWFARSDKLIMCIETLTAETGSDIGLVFDVAREIRTPADALSRFTDEVGDTYTTNSEY